MINNTLSDSGSYNLMSFKALTARNLNNCCLLYFINMSTPNNSNLKKIVTLNLLNYVELRGISIKNKMMVSQSQSAHANISLQKTITEYEDRNEDNFTNLPTNNFYESNETFINTQGLMKRTNIILLTKEKFSNWQVLKKLYNRLLNNLSPFTDENDKFVCFRVNRLSGFKNYTNFKYLTTKNLTVSNYYLVVKTAAFYFSTSLNRRFKSSRKKIQNSRFKYWLDDFYIGGKDGYSHNSVAMIKSSNMLRSVSTNFF